MNPAHQWQGQLFDPRRLLFLRGSFNECYDESIRKNGPKSFIKCYQADGCFIDKTFHEFDRDVRAVAVNLLAKYSNDKVVMTVGGNRYEVLIYMLAALRAGFVLCPMGPQEPDDRVKNRVAQIAHPCAVIRNFSIPVEAPAWAEMPVRVRDSDFAFALFFTSGTTGHSKIVRQTEQGLLTNVDAVIQHHNPPDDWVVATPLPVYHVNALEFSFMVSLLAGRRLIVYEKFELKQLISSVQVDKVTVLSAVPHLFRSLLDHQDQISREQISSLKYLVSAAAPLSTEVAGKLVDFLQIPLIQGYGLSEAINFSCNMPLDISLSENRHWLTAFERSSIGISLFGNDVEILNAQGEILKFGEVGEVVLRGWNLMNSYLNIPPEQIFADGWFHTGDLGFWQPAKDGRRYFFIKGRVKDVVKRAGLTISLNEIDECALRWLPKGADCMSVGFSNDFVGEELVLFIRNVLIDQIDLKRFKEFLNIHLPVSMHPRILYLTDERLRTESGKAQRWNQIKKLEAYEHKSFGERMILVDGINHGS